MIATLIPAAVIGEVWPRIEGQVRAALEQGSGVYTARDVCEALERGDWQLWHDGRSIVCTRIAEYPARRMLFVMLASGEMASVKAMWPTLKAFGVAQGCTGGKAFARPGFVRSGALSDGWRHTQDVLTVEW